METKLEHILLNSHKVELIAYMRSHPETFDELVRLAIADKQRYSWRAAWLLWSCVSPNDKRLRKYLKQIVEALPTKKDSQQRELLMVLQRTELNDDYKSCLFDICAKIWGKVNKNPSLRYNAFKLMVKISKEHPHLSKETIYLVRTPYIDSLSPTVKKSIFKMLEGLK